MGFTLSEVVPWGRSFAEYVAMFQLATGDLERRVLGCGDGPASFNAELTRRGGHVVSIDPIYALGAEAIRRRIAVTYEAVMTQLKENRDDYVWTSIRSVEALGRIRTAAMETFLADYRAGGREGRYVAAELPRLPFADRVFDIALSSHLLFLYSAQLSADFHLRALTEMLRVAGEVRVFPLCTLDGTPSPHLNLVTARLEKSGFEADICRVDYEFQRGATQMLRVKAFR
jgi:SAM-dependent methyltransferase